MIEILLGEDEFSKKKYAQKKAADAKRELVMVYEPENLLAWRQMAQSSLLGPAPAFYISGLWPKLKWEDLDIKSFSGEAMIFVSEVKLDKRLTSVKNILSSPGVKVLEYAVPRGMALQKWIIERVRELGGEMENAAVQELCFRLGGLEDTMPFGQSESTYNLDMADSEIRKLLAFTEGKKVAKTDVQALTPRQIVADAFRIADALGTKNRKLTWQLLEDFFESDTQSDPKAALIQLSALLAEQFRAVAMVKDFEARGVSEQQILKTTLWKSGRLFMTRKLASKYSSRSVLDTLDKLDALDTELKTSSLPGRVILDVILAQIF